MTKNSFVRYRPRSLVSRCHFLIRLTGDLHLWTQTTGTYSIFNTYTSFSRSEQSVLIKKCHLLYRYWWNTRIFPFTRKSYLHRAQWRNYFYLSRVRILVSPWLLTIWNRKYKYYCLYFSFINWYPSFITFLWQAFFDRWPL